MRIARLKQQDAKGHGQSDHGQQRERGRSQQQWIVDVQGIDRQAERNGGHDQDDQGGRDRTGELGQTAAEQVDIEMRRAGVDVFQHLVFAAVFGDAVAQAGEAVLDEGPECHPADEKCEIGSRVGAAAADDAVHHDEDECGRQWAKHGVEHEDQRLSPVTGDLPAESSRGLETPPLTDGGAHVDRRMSRASWRAWRSR